MISWTKRRGSYGDREKGRLWVCSLINLCLVLVEILMYRPGTQIPGLLWTSNSIIANSTVKWMFLHLRSQLCFQLATCHIRCQLWAISCVNCKQYWMPFGTSNSWFRNVSVKRVRFSPITKNKSQSLYTLQTNNRNFMEWGKEVRTD